MNQVSITITADDYPQLTQKILSLAEALKSEAWQNAVLQQTPITVPTPQPQTVYAPPTPPPAAVPAAPQPAPAPVQQAPTAKPSYTLDDLSRAAAPLMDAGKLMELQNLLSSFGVQALTQLKPEQYGEFATGLRGLGAKL